jgi:hypothetical protein
MSNRARATVSVASCEPLMSMVDKWKATCGAVVLCASIAFFAKVLISFSTFGSTDVLTWRADVAKVKTEGVESLYRNGVTYLNPDGSIRLYQPFIHPPFVVHLLRAWDWLELATAVPLQFWMRLTCAASDVATVLLLAGILRLPQYQVSQISLRRLLILALSPILLMISGFHANTDPIMIGLVVAAVYLLEARGFATAAGVALGAAVSIKVAALIFAPVLLLHCGRRAYRFALASIITVLALSSPYLVTSTGAVINVIGSYSSQYGIWGMSLLAYAAGLDASHVQLIAKIVLIAGILALAVHMNGRENPQPLLLQCAVTAFVFLALSPGFGVQYLAWAVPWTVALSVPLASAYQLTGGAFLFLYYNRGARGLPWYFADSLHNPVWYGSVVYAGLICWATICVGLLLTLHRNRPAPLNLKREFLGARPLSCRSSGDRV